MVDLAPIQTARRRLAGHVRRTPLIGVEGLLQPVSALRLTLKLESLQVTGSFQARGAAPPALTPLAGVGALRPPVPAPRLTLKLESLQVTGSFKARGAAHKVLTLSADEAGRGLVPPSRGTHGPGGAGARGGG